MRTVFEGSIPVNASDYTQPGEEDGDEVEIHGLDDLVTHGVRLTFTLDYPFEKPYEGSIEGEGGITLRATIDAIRDAFRLLYRGAHHEALPSLHNELVEGSHGRAYHAIDDLVIELIELDDDSSALQVFIGS